MIEKNHIIDEIKRIAQENEGSPFGARRFSAETGIKESDWLGRYWARWGDALEEAGFPRKCRNEPYDPSFLLEKLAGLARRLRHFPTHWEIKLERQSGFFPGVDAFRRFGSREELAAKLLQYCKGRPGYENVADFCSPVSSEKTKTTTRAREETFGFVYLIKSGKYYKVGRSNSFGRREYELSIQLPEKAVLVHKIKTDDPVGIEQYWHRRFEDRHKNGEWFELTVHDVSAFKRRLGFM